MKFERSRWNYVISFLLTNGNGSMVGDDICVSRGDKSMYFPEQQKWINPEPLNLEPLNVS